MSELNHRIELAKARLEAHVERMAHLGTKAECHKWQAEVLRFYHQEGMQMKTKMEAELSVLQGMADGVQAKDQEAKT